MTRSTDHANVHGELDKKVCLECNRQFTGLVASCPHDNTILVPVAQDPLLGTKLDGKYEILSVLGTGGMGVVYKGKQELMDRIVAIKMLLAHHLNDTHSVKRFLHEGKATCKLKHPHIITVYDYGVSPQGQPYIVMDFLEGVPLSDQIRKEGQIGVDRSMSIFRQSALALEHAHSQGVIHRDLKPSNIVLIDFDGNKDYVKVVDFGVAKLVEDAGTEMQKLTQMGEVCGSPVYMSPEQCQGMPLDPRSDIYSMGIVMYETLTNKLPILGKTLVETMHKHIMEPPTPFAEARPDLYIPERVEQVIFKALSKNPEDRQQSMKQLATEIDMAIPKRGKSFTISSFSETERPQKPPADKKKVAMVTAAVVVGVLAVGGAIGFFAMQGQNKQPIANTTTAHTTGATTSPVETSTKTPEKSNAQASSTSNSSTDNGTHIKTTDDSKSDFGKKTDSTPVAETPTVKEPVKEVKPAPAPAPKLPRVAKKPPRVNSVPSKSSSPAPVHKAAGGDAWSSLLKQRSYKTGHDLE
ncbi:MAG: serine/threonine-protein kinase [Candidatus Melainabacteria bacterium]|nr:serine/threonine-protein kinase [Candidatus Melainabacteria bacterium]